MAAHPGVTVKTNRLALNAYNQTLTTQMQAGNGPDVFYINAGTGQAGSVGQLGKANELLPLDDPALKQVIPDRLERELLLQRPAVRRPELEAFSAIIYNDELAKQNGVSLTSTSTLQDVLSQCAKVKASGKSIFGLAGSVPANTGHPLGDDRLLHGLRPRPRTGTRSGPPARRPSRGPQGWHQALQSLIDLNNARAASRRVPPAPASTP